MNTRVNDWAGSSPTVGIFGPTCARKSRLAVLLAERLGAEILSCDSMQVYRGMDIGTAKPGPETRQRIPHHLVDCLDIHDRYAVSDFVRLARPVLKRLADNGKPAIVVGGSGLYAKALFYNLTMFPADPEVYAQVSDQYADGDGAAALTRELATAAHTPIPEQVLRNPRRLLRAVEILRLTGRVPWDQARACAKPLPATRQYVIAPEPELHKTRIAARVRAMFRRGWMAETAALTARGLLSTPTARQALGYAQIAAYIEAPETPVSDLLQQISRLTVCYARRQRTWFRHQHPHAVTLALEARSNLASLAERIRRDLRDGAG